MKPPAAFTFALLLLLSGCAHRPFIIGMYDAPRDALPELREAGFNTVTMYLGETNRIEYLRAAAENGIGVIQPPNLASRAGLAEVRRLDKHPAFRAWYLSDEPDLNIVSPAQLRAARAKLRRVAGKLVYLVVASGTAVEKYGEIADLIAVDWYPVPWTPVATISREMRSARLASAGRPFLAIIQAFDWSAFPHLIRGDQPLRGPTHDELRCMAYLSLFQGARGILFYSYLADAWKIREHPEMWAAVTGLAAEIKDLAPIFEERVAWWPAETHYKNPAEMYNEIHEGAVALNFFRVRQRRGAIAPGYYSVAINTTPRAVDFAFRLPFEEGEWVQRRYDPFQVAITGPFEGPVASRRLP